MAPSGVLAEAHMSAFGAKADMRTCPLLTQSGHRRQRLSHRKQQRQSGAQRPRGCARWALNIVVRIDRRIHRLVAKFEHTTKATTVGAAGQLAVMMGDDDPKHLQCVYALWSNCCSIALVANFGVHSSGGAAQPLSSGETRL